MKYYDENTLIYLDGSYVKAFATGLDLYTQALHYGYGAFEGLRAYNTHNGPRILKHLNISSVYKNHVKRSTFHTHGTIVS
ncbi:hypothetical protein OKW96_07555 [Sphingobacterium sp. KU25419]|nr:hypothetical protein OKW96_07555 [Sphingobacterium sp. KU25419]